MKNIYIATGLVALLAAATSCDKYDIYPEQYGKVMMLKDAGDRSVTIYSTEDAQPCYISVMKSGHSPEEPAQATLKILNDQEFGDYLEKYYGDRNFEGLLPVKPEFYYLAGEDINTELENKENSHNFVEADDRYFGSNVVFRGRKYAEWYQHLHDVAYSGKKIYTDAEVKLAQDSLESYTFVVPVGLFSQTDTINSDNQYVMIIPDCQNPVVSISVDEGGYLIEDVSRAKLIEDKDFANDVLEPKVTFSIPRPMKYDFNAVVAIDRNSTELKTFNSFHKDIVLYELSEKNNAKDTTYFEVETKIPFPAGTTEATLPLKIFRKYMDTEDLDKNYVVPFTLKSSINGDADGVFPDLDWGANATQVPKDIRENLKYPSRQVKDDAGKLRYGKYCFFVGYRVVETPIEVTGDDVLYCNDTEPKEGSFEGLFDDDLSTFFHSSWSVSKSRSKPFASYFDVALPINNPINALALQVFARVHSNPVTPQEIALYYTTSDLYNEEQPDASSWKAFHTEDDGTVKTWKLNDGTGKNLDSLGSGKVGWFGGINKTTQWMRADEPFNVVRICVIKNSKGKELYSASSNSDDYWNLAGMKIYGTTLK
ncbi:MAG: hypothetical protein NC301_08245 [Bacteroides sp.]|nr:hypothetical protein [Bacteroides sp.]MCM1380174.1 hypothetical protein [Bacteroides sp.]MCM1446477.1 hypothetical protein [Prevotella sp.]